jgi:hypothetical protein
VHFTKKPYFDSLHFGMWKDDGANAQSQHTACQVCAVIVNEALAMTEMNQLVGRRWWWLRLSVGVNTAEFR